MFVDQAYNLCSPSERDFGKEAVETPMANINNNVNPNIKNPIMIFAGYKEQMSAFLKINLCLTRRVKTVLNFANFPPEKLRDITKCKILQQSIRLPIGIEKEFISYFRKIPNSVIAGFNAELAIMTEQERRLSLHCTTGDWKNLLVRMLPVESKDSSKEKSYQVK